MTNVFVGSNINIAKNGLLTVNRLFSIGQYCIYKKGTCPAGLIEGYVFWDDDFWNNQNRRGGTLPDGTYNDNTRIEFCCRTDGAKNEPILLPTETPFFLLAYGSDKCQMVKWAIASLEWIYYDTEDFSNNDDRGGAYPYNAGIKHPQIYYCYYRGKVLTTCWFHVCINFVYNDRITLIEIFFLYFSIGIIFCCANQPP